ncbi:MAG TPA: hypothetical protein VJ788_08855 [Gemmatimonadota bacterium]|nr:hypothetical protein [Gemmatimonadota bacterium]
MPPSPCLTGAALAFALAALTGGCEADLRLARPGEVGPGADTAAGVAIPADTVFRPMPIDSAAASFAWVVVRPEARVTRERSFPGGPEEAARQFLRALAQTGSSSKGTIGVGAIGYERAFTYVHPRVRPTEAETWSGQLEGIVRPAVVRLEPVPGDSSLVFAELVVLREVDRQSMLALYYGHFRAEPGDNGWQLTGARLMAEDWESPLGGRLPDRWDRAGAAREYAAEDPVHALNLIRLHSGEWVPLTRLPPRNDLQLGLPPL